MARNTIHADVPADAVFEVLADPRLYGNWVVGASTTYRIDGTWPDPGAVLHHSQMMLIRDTTSVLECERGRRVVLEARARPVVIARVEVTLEPDGGGTLVVLNERVIGGLAAALPSTITDALIHVRNKEAVNRLKRLAEIGQRIGES
jgi:uncharacterized protein YndB with AHSA1/START domain